MKDKLKIFTEQHREEFEVYKLDLDQTWKVIDEQLDKNTGNGLLIPWIKIMRVAAILIVIMTIAVGYYLNNQRLSIDKNGIALHSISSELADTEAFYAIQIDEKINLIKVTAGSIDSEVAAQLEIFDLDYMSLKKDMKDNADSEEVINAMIEHYRLKLAMLEKILEEIQKDDSKDYEEAQAI